PARPARPACRCTKSPRSCGSRATPSSTEGVGGLPRGSRPMAWPAPERKPPDRVAGSATETDRLGADGREVRQAAFLVAEIDLGVRADGRSPGGGLALVGLERQRPRRGAVGGGAVDHRAAPSAERVEAPDHLVE